MTRLEQIRSLKDEKTIAEIGIADLDRDKAMLLGVNGLWYREIIESIWAEKGNVDASVVYLQTMTHNGGICLKPLFVKIDEEWLNTGTGKEAPASLQLDRRIAHNAN